MAALNKVIKDISIILGVIFLIPLSLFAQNNDNYSIKGTVIHSKSKVPLVGANIIIKNTSFGTSSKNNGEFKLQADLKPGDYILIVSYVGFKTEKIPVTLSNDTTVNIGNIELQPTDLMGEQLVITAQGGLSERKKLGVSITSVEAEEIENTGISSVAEALSGKVLGGYVKRNSGSPAGGFRIRLHGTSTILGNAAPLYVIDGAIISNSSLSVIQLGGTSTSRTVDINPMDIKSISVINGATAAALYGSRANNGVVMITTKMGESGEQNIFYSSSFSLHHIRKKLNVNMATNDKGQFLDNDGKILHGRRYNLQNQIFRTAFGTTQHLAFSGGTDKFRYYVSGSYKNNEGIVKKTNFRKITLRTNIERDFSQTFEASVHLNYINNHQNIMPNGGLNKLYGVLTSFLFGPNTVNPFPNKEGEYPAIGNFGNPLEALAKYDFYKDVSRFLGSVNLTFEPSDNLKIDYTLGFDNYHQIGVGFIPPGTHATNLPYGMIQEGQIKHLQTNNNIAIRYEAQLASSLTSNTLIGGSLQYVNERILGLAATHFGVGSKVITGASQFQQPSETRNRTVIYGGFVQERIGLKNKLFVTVAGRVDASSRFGANDRWHFYPKISAAYLISNENFWLNSSLNKIFNRFKLRAAIGYSGGQTSIGPYARFNVYNPVSVNGNPGVVPATQKGAANVIPERQREISLGFDAGLFNDRITASFNWYHQVTSDLLLQRTAAPSSGFLTKLGNYGKITNIGLSARLKFVPIKNENVLWSTSITFNTNHNEVSGIEGGILFFPDSFGGFTVAMNGKPIGVFYGSTYKYTENGKIKKDEEGLPIEAPGNQVIGNPHPDWTGSLLTNLQIGKHWNFGAQVNVSYGNDVFNFARRIGAFPAYGTLQLYEDVLEGRKPKGYGERVFGIFKRWVEDGSYLKIRELSASYTFYPKYMSLEKIRVNLIGRNLFSFDSYSGYDPETNVGGGRTGVAGFDFMQVPIPRSIILSFKLSF